MKAAEDVGGWKEEGASKMNIWVQRKNDFCSAGDLPTANVRISLSKDASPDSKQKGDTLYHALRGLLCSNWESVLTVAHILGSMKNQVGAQAL